MTPGRFPLALCRPGAALAGLSSLVVLAALNTGANLLFLVLALVGGAGVMSIVAGLRLLRRLDLAIELPALVGAGAPLPGAVRVRVGGGRAGGSGLVWVTGGPCLPAAGVLVERAPGRDELFPFVAVAPERGVVRRIEVELRTRHPFHLVELRRRRELPVTVHVYPRLEAGVAETGGRDRAGAIESDRSGGEGSTRTLRGYVTGDNPRHIHWRASARQAYGGGLGGLVVRELHAEEAPEVVVRLDPSGPAGPAFERAVTVAASACDRALRSGAAVELHTPIARLRFGGAADRPRALRWFAAVTPDRTEIASLRPDEESTSRRPQVAGRARGRGGHRRSAGPQDRAPHGPPDRGESASRRPQVAGRARGRGGHRRSAGPQDRAPHGPPDRVRDRSLDRAAFALVVLSTLALLAAEERARLLAPVALSLAAAALRLIPGMRISRRLWTATSILALVFFPIDLALLSRSSLFASVHLLLYLLVNKVHALRTPADYDHLLVITFLLQLAVCVLAVEAVVVLFFLVFLLAALRLLALLHVAREWEGTGNVGPMPQSGLDLPGLTAFALVAAFLAVPLFFLIPRVGAGTFQGRVFRPQHVTGLGDEVDLADIGRIKEDDSLVARVRPLGEGGSQLRLLRAVSFRSFDGQRWRREERAPVILRPDASGRRVVLAPRAGARLEWFELTVEAMTPFFLPVPERPAYLRGPVEWVQRDAGLTLTFAGERGRVGRITYEAAGDLEVRAPVGAASAGEDPPAVAGYLELPPLDRRIASTASAIVAGAPDRGRAVAAVLAHFASGYRYSLEIEPAADPVARFLLETRAGHCELFATAMCVLLRSAGIPSRVVNGFRVGEWSEIGGYFLVRQSDTHAWVEAFFPEAGWIAFDPTPPDPERSRWTLGLKAASHLGDFLVYHWDRYVITLSRSDQRQALEAIATLLGEAPGRIARLATGRWTALLALALLAAATVAAALGWRRRGGAAAEPEPVRLYRRLRERLLRSDPALGPAAGPLEVLARAGVEPAVREVIELYLKTRFAGEGARPETVASARRALGRVGRRKPATAAWYSSGSR